MTKQKKEVKKYPVETDTVDFQVEWKLSNNEIEDLKKQHLENLDKIDELVIKKKQMQDDFKTQIKQLTIENYKLRATIKKGVEIRTAQCVCNYDYDEGTRTVYHPQTNEVIEKRELTNEEKQMEFEQ